MAETLKASLLTVPPEIRMLIFSELLKPSANRTYHDDQYTSYHYASALLLFLVNKQIHCEARKIFRDLNTFVRVETPLPQAEAHVSKEGYVPIVVPKERIGEFVNHATLTVCIDAPDHQMPEEAEDEHFIIHADDLPKFTRMWFYANLTHPHLNEHLRLVLHFRDPFTPSYEEKHISKSLQRKLLLPFGEVKTLKETIIIGDPKPLRSLETELRDLQAIPPVSPEACLRKATQFKTEGNAALTSGNPTQALELYNSAWLAIHVVIKGHARHIHGDEYFRRELREAPYEGKNGIPERLILRVSLVANSCLAYLKLEDYAECKFWGMRSIGMLREAMGADDRTGLAPQDEAILGFPGADQMGKVYYRTALACKELGDMGEARRLLRVAAIYLPQDQSVKKEIAATALKLG